MARLPAKRSSTRSDLLTRLSRAGREQSDATVLFHATVAERLGLNPTDEKAMSVLQRLGPLSAGEIAKHTGLASASVTTLVDRLERKGFARRVRDGVDRRRVMVEASAGRVAEANVLFKSRGESLARLFDRYSEPELGVILDFMSRNAERLRAETSKLTRSTRRSRS